MLKLKNLPWSKIGLFAGGLLFGTAGLKILGSQDAKKVYTQATAAVLRAKDCVMATADNIRENCNDILTDAKEINEQRAAQEENAVIENEIIEDAEPDTPDQME